MNTEDDEFARIAREQALNKKADNARELGLDYEPDIPFGDNNPGLQWDEVPQAFNDWWNADYDPTGNPFEKDTHAYWAWAGWKAAKQPAQQEPVACIIGARGSAFDSPITKRAYTYKEQPGNAVASKLGRACNEAGKQRAGDNIDRGLGLLQELQNEGFGVFALGAEYTVTQQEPVAWMHPDGRIWTFGRGLDKSTFTIPLYTSPPAQRTWVGLTDEEIASACKKNGGAEWWWRDIEEYARAIEAKLKEKNT